jgi:hypothetical protein
MIMCPKCNAEISALRAIVAVGSSMKCLKCNSALKVSGFEQASFITYIVAVLTFMPFRTSDHAGLVLLVAFPFYILLLIVLVDKFVTVTLIP